MNLQIKPLIQTTKLRRAFTLVEMLLVVTIIGCLLYTSDAADE